MGVLMPGFQAFAPNVWTIDGPNVRDFGVLFTTRMTIVKLANGSVWVDSPVSVSFETLKHITELGPLRYLVVATPRHVWRLTTWHTLFPKAQLWAPRTTPLTLKKEHLPFTGTLKDMPQSDWVDDFDQLAFQGNPFIEEVLFFHKASRTVILGDLIQNQQRGQGKFLRSASFKCAGIVSEQGGVPIDIRLSFTHRQLARQSLNKLLSWDFDKLIIGHGVCIEKDAKPFVEQAFHFLRL
jgi:hypothetical protein